jgi:hypothetical protein
MLLLLPDIYSRLSKTCGIIFVRIDVFFRCFALPNEVVTSSSGVVLAVPSSIENIGNFMLEARKTSGLVPLARTFHDALQWYPTAGRMLDIRMTANELKDYETNPRETTATDDVCQVFT